MFPFNRVIKTLILTDLVIFTGWGFIAPIFAVFIVRSISAGDLHVAGIAVGIGLIVRSAAQVPIGRFLDINNGEKDDFWFMVVGMGIVSFVPLGYLLAAEAWHIYVLQALYGLGMAMYSPPWGGIFMRHMNKGKEAEVWGIESSALGMGAGVAGMAGGFLAEAFGFKALFIVASTMNFVGVAGYFYIRESIAPKEGQTVAFPKH
ncbi:MAG: MFS transporter [Candidatus Spechtbacteria bacterium]|nr:MFS transporter [Candidatus Spechtbacteria bacterium]